MSTSRHAVLFGLVILALAGAFALYHDLFPGVLTIQHGALVVLLALTAGWSAYLGATLAGARAHSVGPTLVSIGESLVQIGLALDRNEKALRALSDLDASERAAATAMLMQAKGATGQILRITEGATPNSQRAEIHALAARIDEDITDSVRELSCIQYEDDGEQAEATAAAVDEAAAAVKH